MTEKKERKAKVKGVMRKPVKTTKVFGPRVMVECAGCFNRYYDTVSACPVCGSTEREP